MSRKDTSITMNKTTSRNFVLGSNLWSRVFPGKYLIRIIEFLVRLVERRPAVALA